MLTLQLWRALNQPPQNSPLYRRLYPTNEHGERGVGCWAAWLMIILGVLLCSGFWLVFGAPYLVLLANTLYGLALAVDASGGIARERERNTYDLLVTSPPGALGVHWAYAISWLHHNWLYGWILLAFVIFSGGAALIVPLLTDISITGNLLDAPPGFGLSLAVALVFLIDYFQSLVIGGLIAALAPAVTHDRLSTRLLAGSGFLLAQLAGYAAAYAFAIMLQTLDMPLLPLLSAAAFYIFREATIVALWRGITHLLGANAAPAESLRV
mgnify:CR=1 FL=1